MPRTLILDSMWFDAARARELVDFLEGIENDHVDSASFDRAMITAQAILIDELTRENNWESKNHHD